MFTLLKNKPDTEPGLRHVVYRHFLKSAVIPLSSLIVLMLLLYFGGTYYTYQSSLTEMRERAQSTVDEIARNKARNLNQRLQSIALDTSYLRTVAERLFQADSAVITEQAELQLERAESGFLYRDLNTLMDGSTIYGSSLPSSLYVSAQAESSESLQQRLRLTEELDLHFQRTVDSNPSIDSAYFSSWDQINRMYPPITNMPAAYEAAKYPSFFKYYYLADTRNNPNRKTIWTEAYLDEKKQRWLLSSITPVYRYGFLEGIIGVNVVLDKFAANLLNNRLIWDSKVLISNPKGDVLAFSGKAGQLLNMAGAAEHSAKAPDANTEKLKAQPNNLLQHSVFNTAGLQFDGTANAKNKASCCVKIKDEEYLLSQQHVEETGWHLIILTRLDKVTQQVTQYQSFIRNLGVYFILLTSLFFVLFFTYLKKQANRLAALLSNPVELVTEYISRLNKLGNNKPLPVMQVGIRELDRLIASGTEIQLARSRLSQLNSELEQKNNQLQTLAVTDNLTGLYNRHKLDDILIAAITEAKRYHNHFSVALVDIDHFKRVNDTYGHQVGDSILVSVAAIMRRRVREADIVGRWGGEEFIIIMPHTSLEQAAMVLDQLRAQIAHSDFDPVESLTVSLGLANSADYSSQESIIAAADEALYRAKGNGRNRLEIEYAPTTEQAGITEIIA